MNESQFTRKLMGDLSRSVCAIKHCDRFTAGIPDLSITFRGRTVWFEIKMLGNSPDHLQNYYLKKLVDSYLITWDDKTGTGELRLRGDGAVQRVPSYKELLQAINRIFHPVNNT